MSKNLHEPSTPSEDGVDPSRVPKRKLYTGALMPAIGLGTFGSDHASADEIAEAVKVLIPMKLVTDSDLIPGAGSDVMPVTVGAKRRWRSYGA